ncbi:MAG TPA: hypothetical protein VGN15_04770 [Ktedonobacteraceae bacterium]|jgi:hypothetical protein|nr:hypothetical protein [Ktedonobacteraceae bacterium]
MNIDSFTAGYRAAAAVAIAESERICKEYYTADIAPSSMATMLEKEERHLKRVLAGEDPYAAYREFLTY